MTQTTLIRSVGACGNNANYVLFTNGFLTISGQGKVSLSGIGGMDAVTKIWVGNGITELADFSFGICRNLEEISLPDTLEVIGNGPFNGCDKLAKLELPKSVRSVADILSLYSGNWELCIHPDNPNFYLSEGSLYDARSHKMLRYCNRGETRYVVPEGTKELSDEAFFCSDLEEIVLTEGLEIFNYYCLASSTKLKSVTFPSTTKAIYEGVVDGCHSLERIACLALVPPATAEFQSFCDLNSNVPDKEDWFQTPLYVPREAIEAYKADSEWGQFETILPVEELEK